MPQATPRWAIKPPKILRDLNANIPKMYPPKMELMASPAGFPKCKKQYTAIMGSITERPAILDNPTTMNPRKNSSTEMKSNP